MKNILSLMTALSLLFFSPESASAQAWGRHTKVIALGFGASQFFHIDNYYYGQTNNARLWYWPLDGLNQRTRRIWSARICWFRFYNRSRWKGWDGQWICRRNKYTDGYDCELSLLSINCK